MSAIQSILIIDTGQTDAVSACSFSGAGSTGVQFNSNSLKPANLDILYTDYGNLIVFNGGDQFFKETGANGTETFKVGVDGAVSEVASCAIPDITAPVITVTGNNPVTVELGTTYTDTGATADGGETVTATVTPTGTVDTSIVREYTITYTATDAAGNIGTATRTVNVVDTTLPLLTVNGDNPATVEMGGTYTDLGATSDGGETVTSTETVDTLTVGAYTITYSATDTAGNIGTATRIVNVVDNTAPIITITGDNPATVELGTTYDDVGATADDGEIVTSTGTVTTSIVGTYTITYTATDANNNTGTATRTVNVVDTTGPVITITGNLTPTIEAGDSYVEQGATADGGETVTADGIEDVLTSTVGTYTITYSATDAANNTGTATRTVTVVDTTAPEIELTGDATLNINVNSTYADPGYTATDIHDGDITSNVIVTGDIVDITTVGSYTVTYNVTDTNGNAAAEKTRTVNVNDSSAPIPVDVTYDVVWNQTLPIILVANDNVDSSANLTYNITTPLTRGQFNSIDNNAVIYQHTANNIGSDSFMFTATDTEGNVSNPGTITLNPLNDAPVLSDPHPDTGTILVDQNSSVTFNVTGSDADNDQIEWFITTNPEHGAITNTSATVSLGTPLNPLNVHTLSLKYTPTLGYFGPDTLKLQAKDIKGAESQILDVSITVTPVPRFEMKIGSFGADAVSLCIASRNGTAYGNTIQANNVGELEEGDIIYYDESLNQKVTSNSSNSQWIPISDDDTSKVVKIGLTGEILQIVACNNTAVSKYTEVKYATNTISYCDGDFQSIRVYYKYDGIDSPNNGIKSLEDLVNAGTPLFSSELDSNLYIITDGTSSSGFIDSGIYSDINQNVTYYKRSSSNTWGTNGGVAQYTWDCDGEDDNYTFSLLNINKSSIDDPNLNQFCATESDNLNVLNIWYNRPIDVAHSSLKDIARYNVPIYKSETGAQTEDQDDLFESNIFSDEDGYLVWDNKGDNINNNWYGYDGDGRLTTGLAISNYGKCDNYDRPNISPGIVRENTPTANDINVFYGFYSCEPEIIGPGHSNAGEVLVWPVYVIDGLHTNKSGDQGSYIKAFTDTLSFGDTINSSNFDSCLEYAFVIESENIDTAVLLVKDQLIEKQTSVVSDGLDIGISSESIIEVYPKDDYKSCIIDDKIKISKTYTFPVVSGYDSRKAGPNFNTQVNYELDNVAKPLLRTNPKLSGNVKIVTSSDGSIFLESISATKTLASTQYKKYPISPNGNYANDVSEFFKANGTPSDLIYLTKRQESDLTVLDSYDKQIEEEYQYGTSYSYSKKYDEKLKIFAPIWSDNNMPKNFVIFRVDNPTGVDADVDDAGNFTRVQDLLKNAEIIKTFDLTNESNLGKYIRNHVQQETFPKSPITVSFGKNEVTNYNGIDLNSGELTSKGEYIYKDFVETDKPLIEANDFITDGFKRNNILCANLINLEFLFDDDTSEDYSVNRYFGLYVDDIDSGTGEISSITNNVITFSELNSLVDPSERSTAIPSNKQMSTTPTLGYVNIDDIFYKISNEGVYDVIKSEVKVEDSTGNIESTIGISYNGNSVNLTNNEDKGYDFVKMTVIDTPDSSDKIAVIESREEVYKFTFVKHTPGEALKLNIGDSTANYVLEFITGNSFTGTVSSITSNWSALGLSDYLEITVDYESSSFFISEKFTNLGDLNMYISGAISSIIRVEQIQTNVNIQNNTYSANYTLDKGTYSGQQFSSQGTTGEIASSIAAAIHNDDSNLDAYNIGSDVWIKSRVAGYRLMQHVVLVNKLNVIDFIKVENEDVYNLLKLRKGTGTVLDQWRAHYLNGGHSSSKSVYVDNETLSEISIGDSLETRYNGVYNKVLDIVEDISTIDSEKTKLILEDKSDIKDGEARVFNQNVVRLGLFSAYDIYDMNFDFYDTSNSDLKELEFETRENIDYEPYENSILKIDPITGEFDTALEASDIFDNDYSLQPVDYFSNLSGILSEESTSEELSERITSEFDRLKENQLKEFATNSRIVPNINKWVLKDTLTVRDQPYYLNTNEVFGRTNFAPDLSATSRNKADMTHEWFYMDKKPKYLKYDELNETFSYINYIEDFELTSDLFKSTKNDYFDKFMITEGFEKNLNEDDLGDIYNKFGEYTSGYLNKDDVNNTFFKTNLKKKYTLIDGGDTKSFASTVFKGLKFVLKNRKEFTNKTALDFVKNSEFNGYKFSILLKTNTDSNTNDIDFEIIQNKKFKFVIFFINLNISDYWIKGNMNRKLLYELNHKVVYDHVAEDYIYANTSFDGALNWNQADFSDNSPYTIDGINHFDGSEPVFDDQILLNENGLYGDVIMDLYPNTPGNTLYKFSIYSVVDSRTIKVVSKPVEVNNPSVELDVQFLPNFIQKQIKYYYADGGTNIHKSILEKLSINSVASLINLNDDSITYTTVNEDDTITNNRFTVNIEDGTEIVKYANLSIEEDNDKPKSYKLFKGIIGYNLVESRDALYYPFLIRHSGAYTVDFTPVITFTDMYTHFKSNRVQSTIDYREAGFESLIYKHSIINEHELDTAKSYYNRYNRCGTTFNLGFIQDNNKHDLNWGVIKNHFYHKVNEINPSGITKLTRSSDKLPLYPLIDEITIASKDVNVFRSSWDSGYYTRAYSSGKTELVPGTLNNTEERSYLASTMMKVKDEYDITSFTYQSVDSQAALDKILKNSTNESEVVFFEDKKQIVADFYVTDSAVRLLKNDGVLDRIQRYVSSQNSAGDKTTVSDDAEFYINKNIIEQFVVDSISLYTKRFKGSSSSIIDTSDASSILSSGFSPDNNFAYKPHKQKPMNFRLIYNKRLGYSYDIKPMIKIKS